MRFEAIYRAVVGFTAMSAGCAIGLALSAAALKLTGLEPLIAMFSESFKLGLAAILGMLGANGAVK